MNPPTPWAPPQVKVCACLEDWRAEALKAMVYGWVESAQGHEPCAGVMTVGDAPEPTRWMSWRWYEMMPGVIAQEGALNIQSSVVLVDSRGRPLSLAAHFREFLTVTHQLAWWRYVDLDFFCRHGGGGKRSFRLRPVEH